MDSDNKFTELNPSDSNPERLTMGREIRKKHVINKVNSINFQDGTVLVNFKHFKYDHTVSHRAKPQPCLGDELTCLWIETDKIGQQLSSYKFQEVVIPNGKKIILVKSNEINIDEESIRLVLPEKCWEFSPRKMRRHSCQGIKVQLIQNSASFYGILIDFSTASFRVEITANPPQTFQWIDPDIPIDLIFSNENGILYSGECRILKQTGGNKTRSYVLEPARYQIQRFKPKEFRSIRQKLVPSPSIIFKHPFTEKMANLKVVDLSGSGFSVEEDRSNAVLLPGMIIPELELNFASNFNVKCKAQALYRQIMGEEENSDWVKCGIAILDMSIKDHGRLSALLHQAKDDHYHFCNRVDMDALWNFFFDSGFIYPKKYVFLEANKEKIKAVYKKLYTQNQKIARHFIYQDKERILGHLAMIRFYENTWLIHHHAADRSVSLKAGIAVLDQIGRFINDSHHLCSIRMNYAFCYFRPENRFPSRVFGGVFKNVGDPKGCSLDTFAYFHCRKTSNDESELDRSWDLMEAQSQDLFELQNFYEFSSGGIMLDAMELKEDDAIDELSMKYRQVGLKRERHVFSLKKGGKLKAVAIINISDVGLNLADLTSNMKIIIVDSSELTKEILYSALSQLSKKFEQDEIPVLVYPVSYVEKNSIPYEKLYNLWTLNMQYTDHYFKYLDELIKGQHS
ncbi:MAG: PilZ domain-containing protein [Desulfobacteraceae bacterium]|nr:MAG: PilZ domain-containing protein [Desulfobacteraceae bacterium]